MHCPECGFVNTEGSNYCQKCGAFLADVTQEHDNTTAAWQLGETGPVEGERMRIGRSPDAEIFLDDVTVSRNHALLVRRRDGLYIDDLGSLNGTYVNRRRIESHRLQHGDELQVGKYKLTYLEK